MTVNGYKCLANLCYIIDEVLKLRQSQWCFPQLIRAAKSYIVSCIGEARELRTILVFYHLLAFVERRVSRPCSAASLQYALLPLQGFWQAVSHINIHGLLYSFSTSSTCHIHLADCDTSQRCPQNFNTFKARPKSKLPGEQANERSIFSTAHFIHFPSSSPHTLGFFIACSFTLMPNSLRSPNLPSKPVLDKSWEAQHWQGRQICWMQ